MYQATKSLSDVLGLEIIGVQLNPNMSKEDIEHLQDLIFRHQVVVFRDQKMTPAEQIAICRQFGEIEPHPLKTNTCQYNEMTIVSNVSEDGKVLGYPGPQFHLWHSDMCYELNPPKFSFLYAEKVPNQGGNTLFSNGYLAYEKLDQATKEKLSGKEAVFGFSENLIKRCRERNYSLEIAKEDQRPDVLHPVFRKHPVTGKRSIFVNWTHTDCIVGFDEKESNQLLHDLFEHCAKPDLVYSHKYLPNDLIVWDNASTLHTGDGTTQVERPRIMRRVVIRY